MGQRVLAAFDKHAGLFLQDMAAIPSQWSSDYQRAVDQARAALVAAVNAGLCDGPSSPPALTTAGQTVVNPPATRLGGSVSVSATGHALAPGRRVRRRPAVPVPRHPGAPTRHHLHRTGRRRRLRRHPGDHRRGGQRHAVGVRGRAGRRPGGDGFGDDLFRGVPQRRRTDHSRRRERQRLLKRSRSPLRTGTTNPTANTRRHFGVGYIVFGSHVARLNGVPVETIDVDVVPDRLVDNLTRCRGAQPAAAPVAGRGHPRGHEDRRWPGSPPLPRRLDRHRPGHPAGPGRHRAGAQGLRGRLHRPHRRVDEAAPG